MKYRDLKTQSDEIIRLKAEVKSITEDATFLVEEIDTLEEEIDFLKDEGLKILNHNLKLEVTVKELTTEVVRVTKLKNVLKNDLHNLML